MEDKTLIRIWAITLLCILEALAIIYGIDGVFFMPVVAAISYIAGYEIHFITDTKKK